MLFKSGSRIVFDGNFSPLPPYHGIHFSPQTFFSMNEHETQRSISVSPLSQLAESWDDQSVELNINVDFGDLNNERFQTHFSANEHPWMTFPEPNAALMMPNFSTAEPLLAQQQNMNLSRYGLDHNQMLLDNYVRESFGAMQGCLGMGGMSRNLQHLTQVPCTSASPATTLMPSYDASLAVPLRISDNSDKMAVPSDSNNLSIRNSNEPDTAHGRMMADTKSKIDWWQSIQCNAATQPDPTLNIVSCNDGLPTYNFGQQRDNETWNFQPHVCPSRALMPRSTSTQNEMALEIPMAMSTSASSQGTSSCTSEDSFQSGSQHSVTLAEPCRTTPPTESTIPPRPPRRMLPSEPVFHERRPPVVPKNDSPSSNDSRRNVRPDIKPSIAGQNERSSPALSKPQNTAAPARSKLKRIEPKTIKFNSKQASRASRALSILTSIDCESSDRKARDNFLVEAKLAGMSYKEIRHRGKFTEAESTLRGRFRSLTKPKSERVRKPEWSDNDLRLLRRAVRKFAPTTGIGNGKIPWKLIAEYIADNGGSYHFGNATCRKRWDELQEDNE